MNNDWSIKMFKNKSLTTKNEEIDSFKLIYVLSISHPLYDILSKKKGDNLSLFLAEMLYMLLKNKQVYYFHVNYMKTHQNRSISFL